MPPQTLASYTTLQGKPCTEDQKPHLPGAAGTASAPLPTTQSQTPPAMDYLATFPHGCASILGQTLSVTNKPDIICILSGTTFSFSPPKLSFPCTLQALVPFLHPRRGWVAEMWVGGSPRHPIHPGDRPTSRFVVNALALAAGGVGQQRGLLVVRVHGAGGNDVVLVLVHQGQLGVIAP